MFVVPKRILKDIDDEVDHPDPCDAATAEEEPEEEDEDYGPEEVDYPPEDGGDDYGVDNHDNDGTSRDTNNEYSESEINGEPSYLPKPSTIDYNAAATPNSDPNSNGGTFT
jgi:hypothetical protein